MKEALSKQKSLNLSQKPSSSKLIKPKLIQSYYNRVRCPGISFEGEVSRTKQAFKEEADINNIMHQYVQTGVLPSGRHQLQFGDFTSADDYADLLNRVLEARQDFDLLPSDIRDRFANSPEQLIKFMSNPDNEKEAISLGLIQDPNPPKEPSAPPKAEPPAAEPTK